MFLDFSLDDQTIKKSLRSPMVSDNDDDTEQVSQGNGEWNTSSTSTTIAICYPLNRRIRKDKLLSSQHSSCSDVSTNSGLQH